MKLPRDNCSACGVELDYFDGTNVESQVVCKECEAAFCVPCHHCRELAFTENTVVWDGFRYHPACVPQEPPQIGEPTNE